MVDETFWKGRRVFLTGHTGFKGSWLSLWLTRLGARIGPVFGPLVLVGDGGRYVEAMPDVRVLLAPFDEARVLRELRRLRIAPLLDGVRGEPPLDVAAFCTAAVALGRLMADRAAGIGNVDVNPLMVGAQGEGCVALDAVVYCEGAAS